MDGKLAMEIYKYTHTHTLTNVHKSLKLKGKRLGAVPAAYLRHAHRLITLMLDCWVS